MNRRHSMPFGAQVCEGGGVRFRLWAPAAHCITLLIDDQAPVLMQSQPEGWHEWVSEQAQAGSRYRYQIDEGLCVPDPASRYNPDDVHGPSLVVDPAAFDWQDGDWRGRPWHEAVIYEVHVGTFTPQGTFAALEQKLDYLAELGVTAIELMPVADFPGRRNWGYDGTLLYAPDSVYGTPEDLKRFIQHAHRRGLMVVLDVVYNHFGPEGNYLHLYAPQFFTERHHTPWGAAINFDGEHSRTVRDFYLHNALYWLEEYHFDGLRLDAVHAILDDSQPDILEELAQRVRDTLGADRHIHLLLENDHNAAHYLERDQQGQALHYEAQWNDDVHHACHVLLTGERDGYYADYADDPLRHLRRCLREGFAYQGEVSAYRHGERRGEPSAHLPPTAFISFLQNHDQVGNRAFGERLVSLAQPEALRAVMALLLISPSPPLLFMGEEWGTHAPFAFFCDLGGELAQAVTAGRRKEFARFERFRDPAVRETIPDPACIETFSRAQLPWQEHNQAEHRVWLTWYRQVLAVRHAAIIPRLPGTRAEVSHTLADQVLHVLWRLGDDARLQVYANLGAAPVHLTVKTVGRLIYSTAVDLEQQLLSGMLPAYTVAWYMEDGHGGA